MDEDHMSVGVPKKGMVLDWDASGEEEPGDDGPALVVPTSSVVLAAGLSSFAFPLGSTIGAAVAVVGLDEGGEDGDVICACDDSPVCVSSCPGNWSGGTMAGSVALRRLYKAHRL